MSTAMIAITTKSSISVKPRLGANLARKQPTKREANHDNLLVVRNLCEAQRESEESSRQM